MKKIFEFITNISEKRIVGNDFMIGGDAIHSTTTRNGIFYPEEELRKVGDKFGGRPLLTDHNNSVHSIVGRVVKSWYDSNSKSIKFNAKIMDEKIKSMINSGLIQDVSIGASVDNLVEMDDGSKKAIGITPLELSLVAVPGDSRANFSKNFVKQGMMVNQSEIIREDFHSKLKGGNKMADTTINVDMSNVQKTIAALSKQIEELKELQKDKTKGLIVTGEGSVSDSVSDDSGITMELSESGKGFAIYRDYSKDKSGKLKRLVRE